MAKKKNTISVVLIHDGYRGKPSGEVYLPMGEYHVGDTISLGLAEYLVANGHASIAAEAVADVGFDLSEMREKLDAVEPPVVSEESKQQRKDK